MLKFRNVNIGYTEKLIGIEDFTIQKGKLYTIFGRNGIGKSTLLNTILGIVPLLDGEISMDGKNMQQISARQRAFLFSHVPSKFEGVQHLTARDFIALGRTPYTNFLGKLSADDERIIDETIELLRIQHLIYKDTSQMSDGERQIISLAKALTQQTPIILLDEPTAFLDYENRLKVLSLLGEIAKKSDVSILQTSHDLELCMEYSDVLLVISGNDGSLIPLEKQHFEKHKIIEMAFETSI